MKRFIYADNAATTQLDMDAFEAMKPYLLGEYGNASQPYLMQIYDSPEMGARRISPEI